MAKKPIFPAVKIFRVGAENLSSTEPQGKCVAPPSKLRTVDLSIYKIVVQN